MKAPLHKKIIESLEYLVEILRQEEGLPEEYIRKDLLLINTGIGKNLAHPISTLREKIIGLVYENPEEKRNERMYLNEEILELETFKNLLNERISIIKNHAKLPEEQQEKIEEFYEKIKQGVYDERIKDFMLENPNAPKDIYIKYLELVNKKKDKIKDIKQELQVFIDICMAKFNNIKKSLPYATKENIIDLREKVVNEYQALQQNFAKKIGEIFNEEKSSTSLSELGAVCVALRFEQPEKDISGLENILYGLNIFKSDIQTSNDLFGDIVDKESKSDISDIYEGLEEFVKENYASFLRGELKDFEKRKTQVLPIDNSGIILMIFSNLDERAKEIIKNIQNNVIVGGISTQMKLLTDYTQELSRNIEERIKELQRLRSSDYIKAKESLEKDTMEGSQDFITFKVHYDNNNYVMAPKEVIDVSSSILKEEVEEKNKEIYSALFMIFARTMQKYKNDRVEFKEQIEEGRKRNILFDEFINVSQDVIEEYFSNFLRNKEIEEIYKRCRVEFSHENMVKTYSIIKNNTPVIPRIATDIFATMNMNPSRGGVDFDQKKTVIDEIRDNFEEYLIKTFIRYFTKGDKEKEQDILSLYFSLISS